MSTMLMAIATVITPISTADKPFRSLPSTSGTAVVGVPVGAAVVVGAMVVMGANGLSTGIGAGVGPVGKINGPPTSCSGGRVCNGAGVVVCICSYPT